MKYDHDDTDQLINMVVRESTRQSTSWMSGVDNGKQMLWNHLTMDTSWAQQLISKRNLGRKKRSDGGWNVSSSSSIYNELSLRQIMVVTILRLLTSTAPFTPREWRDHPCDESGTSVYLKRFVYDYRCDLFEMKATLDVMITTKRRPIVTLINDLFADMVTNNRANVIEWMTNVDVLNNLVASFLPPCMLTMFNVDTVTIAGNTRFDTKSVIDAILGYTMSEDVRTLNKVIGVMDRSLQNNAEKHPIVDQEDTSIAGVSRRIFESTTVQMSSDFDGGYVSRRLFDTIDNERVSQLPSDIFRDINRLSSETWVSEAGSTSISSRDMIVTCFLACMKMLCVRSNLVDAYVVSHKGTLKNVLDVNDRKMKQRAMLNAELGWPNRAIITEEMCNKERGDTLRELLSHHMSSVGGINMTVRF